MVRRADASDWARLRDVRLRALATDPHAFLETVEDARTLRDVHWRERATPSETQATFLEEREASFAAMVSVFVADDRATAYLVGMWVAPELRGSGIAIQLVEHVLEWARDHRRVRVVLSVEPGNDRAARLYEKCGFVERSVDSPVRGGCILGLMLSIGRFADATGLTVKALRHYDEIGLLVPARVDPDNGYRYYEAAQVEDAVTIRRLRALELPLDEIGALLEADGDTLRDRLAAHGYRVAEGAHDKHSLLIELSALVEGGDEQVVVEVRDVPELQLAATIRHLRLVDPEGVTEMLRLAWDRLAERGIASAGPATALFRSGDGNGTHLVEAGFPVATGVEGDELLRVTAYPAASAATTDHVGSYDGLHVTAQRFIATVLGQGLRFAQPIRIEYVEPDVHARLVWPLAAP